MERASRSVPSGRTAFNLEETAMDFPVVSERGRARHDTAVFLCCDAKFFPFALFVLDQIATKLPERDFDLVLLSAEPLPEHDLVQRHDLRVLQIELDPARLNVHTDARIPLAAYLRIFGPAIFEGVYRRLLYLDADMFYQRGDLSRLLNLDMKGRTVGAVLDLPQMRKPWRASSDFRLMGLPQTRYFNSGMLLIDVPAWQAAGITPRALETAALYGEKLAMHDQSALNVVLKDAWLELNPVWNFIYSHQTFYYSAMFDVCFYHFVGRRKPFKGRYGGFPNRFTEPYRRFMTEHWPAALPSIQTGMQIEQKWYLHVFVLLQHAFNARRYLRNEAYWRSDWDTR
jgi:lipopolysaccharide biosynthesis glycosyltransferase